MVGLSIPLFTSVCFCFINFRALIMSAYKLILVVCKILKSSAIIVEFSIFFPFSIYASSYYGSLLLGVYIFIVVKSSQNSHFLPL